MNYCIKAADVVEYSKTQMGTLLAKKENICQLRFPKQIAKKAGKFSFTSGLLLRKRSEIVL